MSLHTYMRIRLVGGMAKYRRSISLDLYILCPRAISPSIFATFIFFQLLPQPRALPASTPTLIPGLRKIRVAVDVCGYIRLPGRVE